MNEEKLDQKSPTPNQAQGPKVLNFSPQKKSLGGLFHKKSFLIGLILTIILAVGAIFTGYYFIQQRITTPPRAAERTDNPEECLNKVDITTTKATQEKTSKAILAGTVANRCNKRVTLWVFLYHCPTGDKGGGKVRCVENEVVKTVTVKANSSAKFRYEQLVGGNGTCGSAQIDARFYKTLKPADARWPRVSAAAWLDPCQTVCQSLTLAPDTGNIPLTVDATISGQPATGAAITHFIFKWTDTVEHDRGTNNNDSFTFSQAGTYVVKGTVVDDKGNRDTNASCEKTVTATSLSTTYFDCNENRACVKKTCGAGETCTSSCDPSKVNPCGSKFNDCVGETCTQSDCPPGETCANKCNLNDPNACKTPTKYHVCSSQNACEEKTCPVGQTCTSTCDPSKANPCGSTFSQCSGEACVSVKCPVGTTCQSTCDITKANSCKTFKHNVCQNSACVQKDCPNKGIDCALSSDCQSDASCVVVRTYQHSVCVNQSCVRVDCSPNTQPCGNECTSNSNCRTATVTPPIAVVQTHKECVNQACVVVNGAGANQCTSDVSCRPVATPPAIPKSGSLELTIMGVVLGVGAVAAGLLLAL